MVRLPGTAPTVRQVNVGDPLGTFGCLVSFGVCFEYQNGGISVQQFACAACAGGCIVAGGAAVLQGLVNGRALMLAGHVFDAGAGTASAVTRGVCAIPDGAAAAACTIQEARLRNRANP